MKPLLTPAQAAALDRATQDAGTPAETLMERAGAATARACLDLIGGGYGRRAVVVCGKGNNGGDGFVAARHLERAGVRTAVILMEPGAAVGAPAAENLERLRRETAARVAPFDGGFLSAELRRADVAVDAIFGTGFRGAPEGVWAAAIEALNASEPPVVAIDIASGVDGATGAVDGEAVRADLTVTFGAAKLGSVLLPGAEYAGDVRVVDIGFDDEALPKDAGLTEPADVASVLPSRPTGGHKRTSGTVVVVAGSRTMTGAARLVARAAARAGAGYVVVAVPSSILPIVQAGLTETVFLPLPETPGGALASDALASALEALGRAHALAIGPGLGRDPETVRFVRELVRESPAPAVVDADALNAFAGDAPAFADRKADAVLTPHLGELERLAGHPLMDPVREARELAAASEAVALVKGTRTVVSATDGRIRVNPTGTPALATAGTGDVLTGTIAGLMARGVPSFDAAWAAAFVHGLAGIVAGESVGDGAVAWDVAERLPEAFTRVVRS
jgi:NAD(P)H-hydrate epimerase